MVEDIFDERIAQRIETGTPFEFSHTLADQIVGFVLTGFYEDAYPGEEDVLSRYIPSLIATWARKEGS